ncbi:MAG: HIT domain-containing protein [Nanoarchaeota archaeon]|nr:HIT domain-containing protein [Nanoarchaeota archaeon]
MVPEDEQKYLFMIAKQISHALLKALKAGGTNIFLANGAVAGQRAPHVMIHIIPRNENDGISCFSLAKNPIRPDDLKKIQLILRKTMSHIMKIEDRELEEEIKKLQEPQVPQKEAEAETKEPEEEKKEPEKKSEEEEVDLDNIANMFK